MEEQVETPETGDEGQPSGDPAPSNPPDEGVPSEGDVAEDVPGTPDEGSDSGDQGTDAPDPG